MVLKKTLLSNDRNRRMALQFILLFGVVSAFGDITYEGARGVYGPFLGALGASAALIGLITGLGEFLGYVLRLVSGYFIDKTKKYWFVTILGYAMLASVPLLAFAGKWQIAAVFIVLERVGKAVRSPGRDAMLSHAAKRIGTGFGFGIHEAMDQIGAIIGPLIFTLSLAVTNKYEHGFYLMWIPVILAVSVLITIRVRIPKPAVLENTDGDAVEKLRPGEPSAKKPFKRQLTVYAIFSFLSVVGFVSYPLISFHFLDKSIMPVAYIPVLYAVAMAVDAVVAIVIGKVYDRKGMGLLVIVPFLTVPVALLGFSGNMIMIIISVILWGCVMGIHETVMRAVIADIAPIENRGFAYGIFNTLYGMAMLIGGVVIGFLYQYYASGITWFVVAVEVLALFIFVYFKALFLRIK